MTLQPQQQQRHHRLSSCHRHPTKPITGFCAACLRERLAGIDPDTHQETPVTRLASELRRTKSYSSSSTATDTNPNAASSSSTNTSTTADPRRKSCDVRAHNSLSDLFLIDDKTRRKNGVNRKEKGLHLRVELKEEEDNVVSGIRDFDSLIEPNANTGEGDVEGEEGELKTMKEFIDLEWGREKEHEGKDLRVIAGSLWGVASVFGKKLGRWQRKQKRKKKDEDEHGEEGKKNVERMSGRRLRETQSEVGEYGFLGRRSCDSDPRLSVDVARLSVDDSSYGFECEPGRVSWDGCLLRRTNPRLTPLLSVIEDVKLGCEGVEDLKEEILSLKNKGEGSPGGTAQTRDYYSEGRRRSFDQSGSNRRVGSGEDELKSMWNAKVSPETVELFHGAKLLVTEKELRDSNWYSLKDCRSGIVDLVSKDIGSVAGGDGKKVLKLKKAQRWRHMWNVWGFMQRKSGSKCGDEKSSIGVDEINGSMPESLEKLRGVANGEPNGTKSEKLVRSYTVSTRGSTVVSGIETKENGTKGTEELVPQRNRSVRYPPNNLENGLLRFYLTPSRNYRRSKSAKNSLSMARNVL